MNIVKTILSSVPDEVIAGVAKNAGTSTVEAKSILGAAAPAIIGAIGKRASADKSGTKNMLAGVMGAVNDGKESRRGNILDTVLGSAKDSVIKDVMKKVGIKDSGLVGKIIEGLLPQVFAGLQKKGISLTQIITIATTLAALKSGKGSKGAKGVLGTLAVGMLGRSLGKKGGVAAMAGKVLGGFLKK